VSDGSAEKNMPRGVFISPVLTQLVDQIIDHMLFLIGNFGLPNLYTSNPL
jgi:hypothetical protein